MTLIRTAPVDLADPDVAEFFDELPLWSAPFAQALLERVPLSRGQTVVDIGSGTGFLSIELAQRLGQDSTVIAVDPWAHACARLRRKLDHLGLDNVKVLEEDAAVLSLPQASVDLVVSNLGINNFTDPDRVLAVCRRILRPGGTLVLSSNLVGTFATFYAGFAAVLRAQGRLDALGRLEQHVANRATPEAVTRRLQAHGFTGVDIVSGCFEIGLCDGRAVFEHYFLRLGFLPDWQAVAGVEAWPCVRDELECWLTARAQRDGGLRLAVPWAVWSARTPG